MTLDRVHDSKFNISMPLIAFITFRSTGLTGSPQMRCRSAVLSIPLLRPLGASRSHDYIFGHAFTESRRAHLFSCNFLSAHGSAVQVMGAPSAPITSALDAGVWQFDFLLHRPPIRCLGSRRSLSHISFRFIP